MLFINTRPADRAKPLTQALGASAFEVLELPLLELVATPWSDTLVNLFKQLNSVQVIVVVSPAAVAFGMHALAQAGCSLESLRGMHWIAVGQATAQALLQFGIRSEVPEVETSEGMLCLPVLQQLGQPARIAFWRGEGGRQFMMDTLATQGSQVLNFVLYQRFCPESTQQRFVEHLVQIRDAMCCVLLISSEASWNNWLQLTQQHQTWPASMCCMVLGARVAQLVEQSCREHALACRVIQLDDLKQDTILKQLLAVQGNT